MTRLIFHRVKSFSFRIDKAQEPHASSPELRIRVDIGIRIDTKRNPLPDADEILSSICFLGQTTDYVLSIRPGRKYNLISMVDNITYLAGHLARC